MVPPNRSVVLMEKLPEMVNTYAEAGFAISPSVLVKFPIVQFPPNTSEGEPLVLLIVKFATLPVPHDKFMFVTPEPANVKVPDIVTVPSAPDPTNPFPFVRVISVAVNPPLTVIPLFVAMDETKVKLHPVPTINFELVEVLVTSTLAGKVPVQLSVTSALLDPENVNVPDIVRVPAAANVKPTDPVVFIVVAVRPPLTVIPFPVVIAEPNDTLHPVPTINLAAVELLVTSTFSGKVPVQLSVTSDALDPENVNVPDIVNVPAAANVKPLDAVRSIVLAVRPPLTVIPFAVVIAEPNDTLHPVPTVKVELDELRVTSTFAGKVPVQLSVTSDALDPENVSVPDIVSVPAAANVKPLDAVRSIAVAVRPPLTVIPFAVVTEATNVTVHPVLIVTIAAVLDLVMSTVPESVPTQLILSSALVLPAIIIPALELVKVPPVCEKLAFVKVIVLFPPVKVPPA